MLSSDSDLERSGRLSFVPGDSTRGKAAPGDVIRAVVADLVEGREVFECGPVAELRKELKKN